MITFICAQDSFRALKRKNEIINEFLKINNKSLINIFDLEEDNHLISFFDFLENQSLFQSKKFCLIYNLFNHNDNKDLIKKIKYFINNSEVFILIYENKTPPSNFKFLTKPPIIYENFEVLEGKKWQNFVIEEVNKRKLKISSSAINFLIEAYKGDSFRLVTELDKIIFLDKYINLEDLNEIQIETSPNFWFLFNQLKYKDLKIRLLALENLLFIRESTIKLFNILAYSWEEKIEDFMFYDRAIKSGKLDYDEAILDIILY